MAIDAPTIRRMTSRPARLQPAAFDQGPSLLARWQSFTLARIARLAGGRLSGFSRVTPP
jgi:hypothetical protein